jgi:DHA2 family multidrug resistance protein
MTKNAETKVKNRSFIIITVMLTAILEVLDSTIVNVALPNMQASLGANVEEITWVLTSYIVASAIMIPLTGYFSDFFGKKKYLEIAIIGFMLGSFLCGIAQNLDQMIVLRAIQGAAGAALIPISQSVLREVYPLSEQPKAMAIWGVGIMMAPILGPTIGGYIVEYSNWRWIFYINMPICIISLILCHLFIAKGTVSRQKIDLKSLIPMFIGVGLLQVFLDQGNTKDWFNSNFILIIAIISALALIFFISRSLTQKKPLVHLYLFGERNFCISSIMLLVFCGCVFSQLTMQPIMLASLYNYPTIKIGLLMAPRGIASGIAMALTPALIKYINARVVISLGLAFAALGSFMMSSYTLDASFASMVLPTIIQGIGMGMFMVPVSTYALARLPTKEITEGSGLFSYGRMLGTSIGVSLLSTFVSRNTQTNWQNLGKYTTPYNVNLKNWFLQMHLNANSPQGIARLSDLVHQQASFLSYMNGYFITAVALTLLIPLALFMYNVDLDKAPMAH